MPIVKKTFARNFVLPHCQNLCEELAVQHKRNLKGEAFFSVLLYFFIQFLQMIFLKDDVFHNKRISYPSILCKIRSIPRENVLFQATVCQVAM